MSVLSDTVQSIRLIAQTDLSSVARIHMLAFPDRPLTALGLESIRRYYEWQLTGPHDAVALGLFERGELAAFCFGGIFRGALSGFLRTNRAYIAWQVAYQPWLLTNPLFRERVSTGLKVLARATRARRPATKRIVASPSPGRPFGILALAVHPSMARSGFGRRLMEEMETIARERNFPGMRLTVSPDNQGAIRFYERLGWQRTLVDGSWVGGMAKSFRSLD